MIEWVEPHEKNVLGYSIDGKMIRGRAKGLALSPTYIKVRKTVYKRLASTSLITNSRMLPCGIVEIF